MQAIMTGPRRFRPGRLLLWSLGAVVAAAVLVTTSQRISARNRPEAGAIVRDPCSGWPTHESRPAPGSPD